MNASMLLLIATSFMMSCAKRVNVNPTPGLGFVPHAMPGFTPPVPMINTKVNPLQHRMQVAADKVAADSYTPPLSNPAGVVVRTNPSADTRQVGVVVRTKSSPDIHPVPDARVLQQTLFGVDSRQLLEYWGEDQDAMSKYASMETVFQELEKGIMIDNIRKVVADATSMYKSAVNKDLSDFVDRERLSNLMVEMVGLVSSEPSADDSPVLAIGAFSRSTITDDGRGSIGNKIASRMGFWRGGGAGMQIDVFAMTGLMDAPGHPGGPAQALMLQIEKYAIEEQRMVVVPKSAYKSGSGEDLTECYVRLGFERVEMEDGSTELVYTGYSSSADALEADGQQIMVGMDLWTHI